MAKSSWRSGDGGWWDGWIVLPPNKQQQWDEEEGIIFLEQWRIPPSIFFDEWEMFIDGGKHAIKWGSSQTYIVLLHYPTGDTESAGLMCSSSLFVGQTLEYSACCVTCHRRWRPSSLPRNWAIFPTSHCHGGMTGQSHHGDKGGEEHQIESTIFHRMPTTATPTTPRKQYHALERSVQEWWIVGDDGWDREGGQ